MRGAYYNEHDTFAAAWLRELIKAGLIADGEVDDRDIQDVRADDLRDFVQCHFFAGIGGWSYALRLAGWPDDRPVWTGSCPCQPFSSAGKREGGTDDRHLWPHWARLIRECQPSAIFGEQVESAIAHGWLDAVFDDLEREGYACGAACLPAGGLGAPHIRQRVWFVANPLGSRCSSWRPNEARDGRDATRQQSPRLRDARALDKSERQRAERSAGSEGRSERETSRDGQDEGRRFLQTQHAGLNYLGHTVHEGLEERVVLTGVRAQTDGALQGQNASGASPWSDLEWIACRDGKARPTQSGLFPLAHGVSNRVGRLRGYGNAIVPPLAAEFIQAYCECSEVKS